jgi:hypothetical protein
MFLHQTFARPDTSLPIRNKGDSFQVSDIESQNPNFIQASFQGGIVKRTLSALMLFGLTVALLQGAPANAQTQTSSIFQVGSTPNENKFPLMGSLAQDGMSPQRTNDASRIGSFGCRWMIGTGCVGAMLYRGLQSSSPDALSKCSSMICFLRDSRQRPHMSRLLQMDGTPIQRHPVPTRLLIMRHWSISILTHELEPKIPAQDKYTVREL